jgi:hypothetical protein
MQLNKSTRTLRHNYSNMPWHLWPDMEAIATNMLYGNDERETLLERVVGPYYF